VALLALAGNQRALIANETVLAITHVNLIDATGAPTKRDVTVIITNDRISAVGRSRELHPPTNAVVVDVTGKFLIPGLWDMHVHWSDSDYLPLFIANGVTGVRIMWGFPFHHEWRKKIESGSLLGPRMFIASALVDGPKPFWPGSITAGNAVEGQEAVRKAREEGADFIKVYSALPREAYFAIAEESRKQRIPFAGHVPDLVSAEEASCAGQRSFEHLTGILRACSTRETELMNQVRQDADSGGATNDSGASFRVYRLELESYSEDKAKALFAVLKRNHTWQCPTLTVLHSIGYFDDPSVTNDIRLKFMPKTIRSMWDPSKDFRFRDWTSEDLAVQKRTYQKDVEIVGAMHRAGVELLAGTDVPNPYCYPGFSLHDELGLLVKAGLTPMEALQTATRDAARFMERDNELGTVERGKLADLVLLNANPLEDIGNTRKIDAVVLGGRLFTRAALNEMRSNVETLANRISIAEPLLAVLKTNAADAAVKEYQRLKSSKSEVYDFGEGELNNLGYELLGMKRTRDAVKILELNTEAYPQSSNVYDSLGEAYMADGSRELAIQNYEKSLRLDPKNANAVEKLKELRAY
jgi:hypothetical protein